MLWCLVPGCDGLYYNQWPSKEELWDKYYTGSPKQRRRYVNQFKRVEIV